MKTIREFFSPPKSEKGFLTPGSILDSNEGAGTVSSLTEREDGQDNKDELVGICTVNASSGDISDPPYGQTSVRMEKKNSQMEISEHIKEKGSVNDNSPELEMPNQQDNFVQISYTDFLNEKQRFCKDDRITVMSSTPKIEPRRIKTTFVAPPMDPPHEEEMPRKSGKSAITHFFSKTAPKNKPVDYVANTLKFSADIHGSPKKLTCANHHALERFSVQSNVSVQADFSITYLDSCVVTPDEKLKKTVSEEDIIEIRTDITSPRAACENKVEEHKCNKAECSVQSIPLITDCPKSNEKLTFPRAGESGSLSLSKESKTKKDKVEKSDTGNILMKKTKQTRRKTIKPLSVKGETQEIIKVNNKKSHSVVDQCEQALCQADTSKILTIFKNDKKGREKGLDEPAQKKVAQSYSVEECDDNCDSSYSVSLVSAKSNKRAGPVKLKFTKLRSTNPETNIKVNYAQRLVQKAKQQDLKKPTVNKKEKIKNPKFEKSEVSREISCGNTSDKSNSNADLRRSRRQCAREASSNISKSFERKNSKDQLELSKGSADKSVIALSSDEEVKHDKNAKKLEKTKPTKNVSSKCNKNTTGVKLASIFAKNVQGKEVSEPTDEVKPLSEQEKTALIVKRSFLLSGLPVNIQQQQKAQHMYQLGDFPPLPEISHVLQVPKELSVGSMWKLPNVSLPLKVEDNSNEVEQMCTNRINILNKYSIKNTASAFDQLKQSCLKDIDMDVLPLLLAETRTSNPSYPVNRVYKRLGLLNKSANDDLSTESRLIENDNVIGKSTKNSSCPKRRKVNPEKTVRRSKRSQHITEEVKEMIEETDTPRKETAQCIETSVGNQFGEMQWTEKYQPQKGCELLGNTNSVRKLNAWMMEWMHRLDAEMRKIRKQQMKQLGQRGRSAEESQKGKKDESDDFMTSSDEDSECEDDDGLCSTILLTGPHGSGKSAVVYALAKELGYKVFEVNSSSQRNGRKILSQLQEATQSQQVTKKMLDCPSSSLQSSLPSTKDSATPKQVSKLPPTSFSSFFKDRAKATKDLDPEKSNETIGKMKKKRKRKSSEVELNHKNGKTLPQTSSQEGLHLCSKTLILFEEVDVVFDEDKGFWSAVDQFMATTKVPIILTTTDNHFSEKAPFGSRVEKVTMKTPTLNQSASYLQLVCLAEGVRVTYKEIQSIVHYCKGDLRRCLLQLQFVIQSGGGIHQCKHPIQYNPLYSKCENPESSTSNDGVGTFRNRRTHLIGNGIIDSEDDFDVVRSRPLIKKHNRMRFMTDESSLESFDTSTKSYHPNLPTTLESMHDENSTNRCSQPNTADIVQTNMCTIESSTKVPLLHECLFTGLVGLSPTLEHNFLKASDILESEESSSHQPCLDNPACDILYSNLLQLLPLPCSAGQTVVSAEKKSPRYFKRLINNDMWDDSVSEDENDFHSINHSKTSPEQMSPMYKRGSIKRTVCSVNVLEILDSFVQLHDGLCDADILSSSLLELNTCGDDYNWRNGSLVCGYSEELGAVENIDQNIASNLVSHIKSGLIRQTDKQIKAQMQILESSSSADDRETTLATLTFPISPSSSFKLTRESDDTQRLARDRIKCVGNTATTLPLLVRNQQQVVAIDYMPVIRNICQVEQLRKAYAKKRRFFHYLDQIVSSLKTTTIDTLSTSLN